jgi:hypothetical protein
MEIHSWFSTAPIFGVQPDCTDASKKLAVIQIPAEILQHLLYCVTIFRKSSDLAVQT